MSFPAARDARLVEVLRALPYVPERARPHASSILARAEAHGLAGVVHDALRGCGVALEPELERTLAWRQAAREADHAAHLGLLGRLDDVLARADLPAVVLKGALFGERFYARPSSRSTSDIDLLVDEATVGAVLTAVSELGYVAAGGAAEDRFRREHHHLHCSHPNALPLEVHFHAYRGFGHVLPSEPLLRRRSTSSSHGFSAIGVLAPEDELVYLAVHAASHRFVRLGWLYDMQLLLGTMSRPQLETAASRARSWGYGRSLAFAAYLLVDVLGVTPADVEPLQRRLDSVRRPVVRFVAQEPAAPLLRSATRFVYTIALCDTFPAAVRYARSASMDRVRQAFDAV
jgi:hypothetical protein